MALTGYAPLGRTVAEMVTATESHLFGAHRTQLNKLGVAIGSGLEGTITAAYELGGIRPGAYLEIDDEVLYVWAVTGQVATVERGQLGSVATTHALNSLIRVAPRFTRISMLRALREDIASWPAPLCAVLSDDFSVGTNIRSVDLAGALGLTGVRLLALRRQRPDGAMASTALRWPRVTGATIRSDAGPTYPSGYALSWPSYALSGGYRVTVGAAFKTDPFISSTDVGTIGLRPSLLDIPPIGAAARLLFPREIKRTDDAASGRARLAEEVPPGFAAKTAQDLLDWRDRRIDEEISRLNNDFGWTEA